MSETPDEAAIDVEFDELLEGSTPNSPAAKYIRAIGDRQMEEWAKRQVIRAYGPSIICIIPVTGPVTAKPFTGTGIDEIYAALGTDEIDKTLIDATEDWGVYAWVGDHSLLDGSMVNRRITAARDLVRADHGQGLHPLPLCGTVVLMAFDRRTGESIDLPARWRCK